MNDSEINDDLIKSAKGRIEVTVDEQGLICSLSIKDVSLKDNGKIYAVCENTVKSDAAALKAVPIVFEATPKDVKICATETARFKAVTNKAGVEVRLYTVRGLFFSMRLFLKRRFVVP